MPEDPKGLYLAGGLLGAGTLAALALGGRSAPRRGFRTVGRALPRAEVIERIRAEAARMGVDPQVALLWADLESGLRSNLAGDLDWPYRDGGSLYRRVVLGRDVYDRNPYRRRQELWVSYGLFQLLSPWWLDRLDANANPEILADPDTNIRLGVDMVHRRLAEYGGDMFFARLAAGCGRPERCSLRKRFATARRMAARGPGWGLAFNEDELRARATALA